MSISTIQSYIEYVEEKVHTTVSNAAADSMPMIQEALHRFSVDVSRFGFQMPEIHMPSLGDFEVPPPPPPPPPPLSFWESTAEWAGDHPWKVTGIGAGVVGVGLLVGYGTTRGRGGAKLRASGKAGASSSERRRVVVVLGGDTPLALPLIQDLEKNGFIVVTSVATPEAADELESRCNGYVRALVLDPVEPATIPIFLRSLASTLSRRFPINAPGDPHSTPATHPHIHSIISLLTLPSSYAPPTAPLEHLHLRSSYLPYLNATHLTPLQVIQALLPLLRSSPARARDAASNNAEKKSIIVCIPAAESRVGLPFAAANAMSAAATLRGIEVLRREIDMATLTGDAQTSMGNVKVIVVDVGAVEPPQITNRRLLTYDAGHAMDAWTPSEKLAYGAAYQSILEEGNAYGVPRKPTDVGVFVKSIVDVVRHGRRRTWSVFGVSLGLGPVAGWISGERFSVGAGASTYALASYLPTSILDIILNIPHFLLSIRNALVYAPPRVVMPPRPSTTSTTAPARPLPESSTAASAPTVGTTAGTSEKQTNRGDESGSGSGSEQEHEVSETGSEADVESNTGEGHAMGESWVSLQPGTSSMPSTATMSSQASSVAGDA
ncbi:uncharacterized protein STEHIDRAFT_145043 [Stereum hirsutum FP-91666 SS1]|uniref:uncharacterized protein n=1 Tax=Stereum hirsutum (strain FP-91666) TaxID=721885 RepID=UPI000440C3F5|nr:uncharacterized protein STEHIDRAFT_145043 [Stereum hirsutum FP-91666 SS1]EIM89815.1 hypothetical protein STEHIDRAFT_145043 [Stereum hirsutum FP-91666 SS1]